MKKLLLSLIAVLGLSAAASAEVATFDCTNPTSLGYEIGSNDGDVVLVTTLTSGNVTITADNGTTSYDSQKFRFYNSKGTDITLRNSAKGSGRKLTFATTDGSTITSIVFTASTFASNAFDSGTLSEKTWTGNAATVTMSVPDASGGNTISKIEVTTVAEGELAAPTFSASGTYYEPQTVTISQPDADHIYYTLDGTEPTTASTLYAEPITVSETTTIKAIATKGSNTSAVATTAITIEASTEVKSIAEAIACASSTVEKVNFPLTVAYVSGGNIFATDAAGDFIQVYLYNSGLKANDVIPAGWFATYTLFSTYTHELVPVNGLPAVTETADFTAAEADPAKLTTSDVNSVVVIKNVTFEEATPADVSNFTGTVGDDSYTFRNNYKLASVEAGTYNVTIVVTVYNGSVQLYPINYVATGESGINTVNAAATATSAEVYNLQGIRVANPTRGGIYIVNGRKLRL
jgi:hypothetical protein